MSQNDELTPKQMRAVAALMAHSGMGEAAAASDVNVKTLERWLDLPLFRTALRAAQRAAIDQAGRRLASGVGGALDVLEEIQQDASERGATRLRAAEIWLDQARQSMADDLEERLTAVEAQLRELRQNAGQQSAATGQD